MNRSTLISPLGPVVRGGSEMAWSKGARAGDFLFLSGLEGTRADDGSLITTIEEQTRLALDRGQRILRESGSDFDHVVRILQFLVSREHRPGFHRARESWFEEHAPTLFRDKSYGGTMIIAEPSIEGSLIELEVIAVVA